MAKCGKCKEVECEECPEWIFTLADLIMCMMGLFVILWCLKPSGNPLAGNSTKSDENLTKITAAIRDAFGYVPDPASLDPVDIELIQQKLKGEKVPRGPGEGAQTERENEGTDGQDKQVTKIREGENSSVGTALPFEAGSAVPGPEVLGRVKEIAGKIRGHRNIVVVKGHASLDDFSGGGTERERRELSTRRAEAVADMLLAEGISPEVVRVQGCSTWEPVMQRKFGAGAQAANRRVEVEVSNQLVEERQDRAPRASPGPTLRSEKE